jgi:nitrate reductase assembly molybdenum cofactor insertion protein NarJ
MSHLHLRLHHPSGQPQGAHGLRPGSRGRLLVESDSPAIAPLGVDFERNEPAYLPLIVETLAQLRDEDPAEVAAYTAVNAREFFTCCQRNIP